MAELSNGASCPLCGLPLSSLVEGVPDAPTIAELTREITYLRQTVARLRGSGFTGPSVSDQLTPDQPGGGSDHAH